MEARFRVNVDATGERAIPRAIAISCPANFGKSPRGEFPSGTVGLRRRCLVRLSEMNPVYNTALILFREVTMSVRLNITMDEDVYSRLKKAVPPKKLSAFIAEAIRAKLHPDAKALNAAYQAASKEQWRANLDKDWKHVDDEGWPK